jgi:hypothetical protein
MHTTKSEKIILILIFPFLVSIFLFSKNASSPDLTGWVLIPGESNSKGLFSRRVYGNISGDKIISSCMWAPRAGGSCSYKTIPNPPPQHQNF